MIIVKKAIVATFGRIGRNSYRNIELTQLSDSYQTDKSISDNNIENALSFFKDLFDIVTAFRVFGTFYIILFQKSGMLMCVLLYQGTHKY